MGHAIRRRHQQLEEQQAHDDVTTCLHLILVDCYIFGGSCCTNDALLWSRRKRNKCYRLVCITMHTKGLLITLLNILNSVEENKILMNYRRGEV